MDAVDILKVCLRRWYVMLPILLGAAGVGYQLVQAQETTFTAYASYAMVQTPSAASGRTTGELANANPLGANNDGTLIGAALEAQLNSRETQEELGSDTTRGWGPGEAENGSSFAAKIPVYETTYEIRAWGEDEQAVSGVVNRVIEAAPDIADRIQDRAGAPASGRYQPFILAPPQVDALPSTSGMKLVVAVMGIGVMMGAAWSIVADRILRQRERRRSTGRAEGATAPGSPEVQDPTARLWEPVMTPAGGPPGKPQGTDPPEPRMTSNGQRRANGKVAGPPRRQPQQRRRTGGK
jgi:hypothetical protein